MPDFQGRFQYLTNGGAAEQEGAFRLHFDAQTATLTPERGAALVFDLGDLDAVTAADYEIRLALYTGRTLLLRQLGKSFDDLTRTLTEAYRNRMVQCMLLEDMGEVARFTGNFEVSGGAAGPAEIRLYKSNLAVLPVTAGSFQWRLADVEDVKFDAAAYEVTMQCGVAALKFTRLAKRTQEFFAKVQEAMNALATQTAQTLHGMLPFLDPDQLQACAGLLREGRSARLSKLAVIHQQIPAALVTNAVDNDLKAYYDQLVARTASGQGYAGFKLIRREAGDDADAKSAADSDATDVDEGARDADADGPEALYWFFFPLARQGTSVPANVVAWEANSQSGRATYFFRMVEPGQVAQLSDPKRAGDLVDGAIRRLNSVLAMLNFRRRPIYLSDDELAIDPKFHRYAIAARRLPEVREVRASFLGRALHTSPEAWQAQVDEILRIAD